ncbi:MAG: aminopeptidase N, partial [Alphaproteobacteria bacterium]
HEYFHNWTGNRITCRDWFELSLKEGLTVFRDQQFSADMRSAAVKRIEDVRDLRLSQFAEDASALAHPVRPESYAKIDNFYTATVYIKGAEVIRMLYNLVGPEGFRKGTDLYFERHDGEAVRIEDWVKVFEDACGRDLSQFRRWYSQAGTPVVKASGRYDPESRTYELTLEQETPATPGQPEKLPLTIPLSVGLLDREGNELPLTLKGESGGAGPATRVLELSETLQTFTFENVPEPPTPSLLREFSAPVSLRTELGEEERLRLIGRDADPFVRWETAQDYATNIILKAVADRAAGKEMQFPSAFGRALRDTLVSDDLDPAFRAQMLTLPGERELALAMEEVDVDGIHEARSALRRQLARDYGDDLRSVHHALTVNEPYDPGAAAAGRRSLRNACLSLLCAEESAESRGLALHHYESANNMTDSMAALSALTHMQADEARAALDDFYGRWKDDSLVVNKWLGLNALSARSDTLERVKELAEHPAFSLSNPNKVRSLIGAFAFSNPVRFHAPGGEGYEFFGRMVLELDRLNPAVAARMLTALRDWKRYDPVRREKMKALLERLREAESLSENASEIVFRTLGAG